MVYRCDTYRVTVLATIAVTLTACNNEETPQQRERKYLEEWSEDVEFSLDYFPEVEKKSGEDFRIMLFTDLQLWSDEIVNRKVFELMGELVEEGDPNLIVLLGDNVSGLTTNYLMPRVVEKMESYGVPWAPVFGNHDTEGILTLEELAAYFEDAENCLFETGPENLYGAGNYAVNVTENGKIVETLFFFDNGRYTLYENGVEKEIYLSEEQIGWYEWTVNGVKESQGKTVPSMTFSHFAMPHLPGVAPVDSGFFAKAKELGSTTHIFCGHDHENNASILYEGIRLTYGLKTGPSPVPWNDADYYGATVIEIGNDVNLYNIEKAK